MTYGNSFQKIVLLIVYITCDVGSIDQSTDNFIFPFTKVIISVTEVTASPEFDMLPVNFTYCILVASKIKVYVSITEMYVLFRQIR
jgi:hypothetical protein